MEHTVSKGVVKPETDNIKQILNAPRPTTKTQVKSFLWLVGYYHDYIPHFVSIVVQLTDLLRTGQPTKVVWGEAQQKAFGGLNHGLTGLPIFHVPDFDSLCLADRCI